LSEPHFLKILKNFGFFDQKSIFFQFLRVETTDTTVFLGGGYDGDDILMI